jgi:hypothetical protein
VRFLVISKASLMTGLDIRKSARLREKKGFSKKHDVFVITSEHLHSRVTRHEDIQSIAKFLNENFDETKIVCYFRNQFDMAVSQYSTLLKVSSADTIQDFIRQVKPERYYYNFFNIAENWSRAFGVANCVFKVYDKALFIDNDIRKDFLSELLPEIELAGINFEINSANESLTCLQGAAFRSVNKSIPYWDKINGGVNSLNVLLKKKISQLKVLRYGKITSKARSELEQLFRDSNRKFFSKYFTDTSHFSSHNDESKEVTRFTIDEVENIVSDIFDAILPLVSTSRNLRDEDANYLRDIAVKIEKGVALSMRDASDLMKLASRARPGGSFIAKKVAQYQDQLGLEKLDE